MSNSKRYSGGNKGSDLSYRGKVLKGLQGVFDNTDQLEGISQGILNVLVNLLAQNQLDFEIKSVKDANGDVFQLRGTLDEDTGVFTWDYIDAEGNAYSALNLPGGPQVKVEFLNPDGLLTAIEALLTTIDADTSNLNVPLSTRASELTLNSVLVQLLAMGVTLSGVATETTLSAQAADIATIEANIALLNSKFNTLGRKAEAVSTSVAIDNEAYAALLAIQTAVQNIDSDLGTGGLALETTQVAGNGILTTIDAVLDASKLVLDSIDADTAAMVVDLAAIEVLITTTNSLLTTIDAVIDQIQTNTLNTVNELTSANLTLASILADTTGIKNKTDLLNFIATALEVNVTSSVLPTGAATEATLGTLATEASLGAIKVSVGTDGVAHGAAQKGIRALGTDGTNDQQISTDADGKVNVLVQNPSPIPVSGTVTVNQPVSIDDNGGSLTVDTTDLDIRDLAFATDKVDASGSTVALDAPTLLALESVTVQNAGLANAVNIQDGGNSITIDNANLDTALAPATRTHNTVSATGAGSVPAGSMCGSVINAGSAAGTWNGISLPAGISIPWTQIGPRDTYGAIAYDATGTTFIIEYTT